MSIRLNKAIRELNIGLQTAADFLKKKYGIEGTDNPNLKLTDEQYEGLKAEFVSDAAVRSQAEKLSHKTKQGKEEKNKQEEKGEAADAEKSASKQRYTVLGKINLDDLNKPKKADIVKNVEENAEKTSEKPLLEEEKKDVAKKEEKKVEVMTDAKAEVRHENKNNEEKKNVEKKENRSSLNNAAPSKDIKPVYGKKEERKEVKANEREKVEEKNMKPSHANAETSGNQATGEENESNEPFRLEKNKKSQQTLNVLGKIDLSAINQSTRPKKKSREEKRREREEKAQQIRDAASKKKRTRIGKERVDINDVVNQSKKDKKNKIIKSY